jgi:hypothetical protein
MRNEYALACIYNIAITILTSDINRYAMRNPVTVLLFSLAINKLNMYDWIDCIKAAAIRINNTSVLKIN